MAGAEAVSGNLDFIRVKGEWRRPSHISSDSRYRPGHDTDGSEWVSPLGVRIRCVRVTVPGTARRRTPRRCPAYDVYAADGRYVSREPTLWWATRTAMLVALGGAA